MNKKINELQTKLESMNAAHTQEVHTIRDVLQKEYNKVFGNDKSLEKALTNLESATEYGTHRDGEIYHWYRFGELGNVPNEAREYLETYVSEQSCAYIDWDNDCLYAFEGGCLLINDDGDVYDTDSGKFIIDHKDYESDDERNQLIEAHMNKAGYYPGVFRQDRYGNIFPVNTQKKAG